jgi:multicomponent K+:H+ antiporter subunit G
VLQERISIQEILITFFLFITAPVTAHFLAKASLHTAVDPEAELPRPGGSYGWSTFESAPEATISRRGPSSRPARSDRES